MSGAELFALGLLALGWIIFQVLRRVFTPPRPLGTIADEEPAESAQPQPQPPMREAPLDTGWGRAPEPPAPFLQPPVASEPFRWSVDAAQAELETSREVARRQARARQQQLEDRKQARHPHRPQLRNTHDLRNAVVLAAVLGPCRALDPYQPPDASGR